ncbi:MAG: hypothetical protein OYG32_04855 [Rhodospirillaceae bacterium]|nr:hypothetical protein [Rhodospirillaceae bacterium]
MFNEEKNRVIRPDPHKLPHDGAFSAFPLADPFAKPAFSAGFDPFAGCRSVARCLGGGRRSFSPVAGKEAILFRLPGGGDVSARLARRGVSRIPIRPIRREFQGASAREAAIVLGSLAHQLAMMQRFAKNAMP